MPRYRNFQSPRKKLLSAVAQETLEALPKILKELPDIDATGSASFSFDSTPELEAKDSPHYTVQYPAPDGSITTSEGFIVRVVNADTLDTATSIADTSDPNAARVCVLNLASDKHPGGGWLNGALAQEESICYRSSLYLSLHQKYYPFPDDIGLYTPAVVIIRTAYGEGHVLIGDKQPSELDQVAVMSIAALRSPETARAQKIVDGEIEECDVFAQGAHRDLTKEKMRLTLRTAVLCGHSRLVLGAMGCGAFRNPAADVAICWREVLGEEEFKRGWFEKVMFAVLDKGREGKRGGRGGKGNFETFQRILGDVAFAEGKDPFKVVSDVAQQEV